MFASPVAIGAVFSIGAIAQYTAFIFPVALKLFSARDRFRPGKESLNANNMMENVLKKRKVHGIWGVSASQLA